MVIAKFQYFFLSYKKYNDIGYAKAKNWTILRTLYVFMVRMNVLI